MNFKSIILSLSVLLAGTVTIAQARHHHRHHGPSVHFGLQVGYPVARPCCAPYVVAPYYPYYQPVVVAPRPHVGFSIGHGPFGFSLWS